MKPNFTTLLSLCILLLVGCKDDNKPELPTPDIQSFDWKWARLLQGPTNEDEVDAVASDAVGNVYLSGKFEDSLTIDGMPSPIVSNGGADIMVVKYDKDGNWQWTKHFGGTGEDNIFDATTDLDGNLLLSGFFESDVQFGNTSLSSMGGLDMVVVKMDPAGEVLWAKQYGGAADDGGNEIEVGANNQIIVGAQSEGTFEGVPNTGLQDAHVLSLTADGAVNWVRTIGGAGNARSKSIEVDAIGNVYMGGDYEGPTALESSSGFLFFEQYGDIDAYIASWSATGDYKWSKTWGGSGHDICKGISTTPENDIYVVGGFTDSLNLDGLKLLSEGQADLLVWKINPEGESQWLRHIASTDDVFGAETAVDANNNLVFGLGLPAPTRFTSTADTIEIIPGGVGRMPMLIQYSPEGDILEYIVADESGGSANFGELSISNNTVYTDCQIFQGPHRFGSDSFTSLNNTKDAVIVAIRLN